MAVVMEAFDGCFLDRPVHPFNLTIAPGMIGFRQTMLDPVSFADHVEAHWTRPGRLSISFLDQLCDSEFACPVNGNEEVQLAFSGLDFRYVEMKKTNRVAFEALASWLVSLHVRQS